MAEPLPLCSELSIHRKLHFLLLFALNILLLFLKHSLSSLQLFTWMAHFQARILWDSSSLDKVFCFCNIWAWIWGLMLVRQELYHLSNAQSPFSFSVFFFFLDRVFFATSVPHHHPVTLWMHSNSNQTWPHVRDFWTLLWALLEVCDCWLQHLQHLLLSWCPWWFHVCLSIALSSLGQGPLPSYLWSPELAQCLANTDNEG
jgi:hypothetical protein